MVRGQGYLEGELNESLLVANASCQIFIEESDDWLNAVIVGRKELPVPHTEVTIKLFTVDYKLADGTWTRDENIRSEKLRLLATVDGEPTDIHGNLLNANSSQAAIKPVSKPKIDQATGISGWQTVSVTLVDPEEVERQRILDEETEREEAEAAEKAKLKEMMVAFHRHGPEKCADFLHACRVPSKTTTISS
jgi:hypothetical protein